MINELEKRIVPLDLIFSQQPLVESAHPYHDELAKWEDAPIVTLRPYMSAVQYIKNSTDTLDDFVEFSTKKATPETIERCSLDTELRRALSPIRRFYRPSLPVVARLTRDRLVLQSGNLECCLAKYNRQNWLDVLMPKHVAQQWDARPTKELDDVITTQGRTSFYTPIMHSKYRRWKVSRMGTNRLDLIRTFLGTTHKKLSLLDIGCNTGFYTFHFYRQGLDTCGIDLDPDHLAVAESQRSMYSADIPLSLCSVQDFRSSEPFDVVLAMSVFWHLLGWGKRKATLTPLQLGELLDRLVGHTLFWEGGKRAEEETELIRRHSSLRYYRRLGITSATGIDNREFGVFTKRPTDEVRAYLGGAPSA